MTAARTLLGAAVLAGERLHIIDHVSPKSALAVTVGLASRGADTARSLAQRLRRITPQPPARMRHLFDEAGRRGALTLLAGKRDASRALRTAMDEVVDDIAANPRIRSLIAEQGQGALSDATQELRANSAAADARVEKSFRQMFHIEQ